MGCFRAAKFLVSLVLVTSVQAGADAVSCLPEFNSLRAVADFSDGSVKQTFKLKSENINGLFESKVRLTATLDGDLGRLTMKFHWDESFGGVSLPYNLYSVLVLQSGQVVGWFDFSNECQGPGVGFYPGQSFTAKPLKVDDFAGKQFKFIVWGRIN